MAEWKVYKEYDKETYKRSLTVKVDNKTPLGREGELWVRCTNNSALEVAASFSGNPREDVQLVRMKWCINNRKVIDDPSGLYWNAYYVVSESKREELARLFVTAEQIRITGHKFPGPRKELEFQNLIGGEKINDVLIECGLI